MGTHTVYDTIVDPPCCCSASSMSASSAGSKELDKSQFEGMIRGEMYSYADPYIQKVAGEEAAKVKAINAETDEAKRMRLFRDFMGLSDDVDFYWVTPFFAEYGCNLKIGTGSGVGPGATVLNVSPVTIGDRTIIGPNVQFYAATHPTSPEERNGKYGKEYSRAITIGDDCWIGGAVVICPGVKIGNGSTVAAERSSLKPSSRARWLAEIPLVS